MSTNKNLTLTYGELLCAWVAYMSYKEEDANLQGRLMDDALPLASEISVQLKRYIDVRVGKLKIKEDGIVKLEFTAAAFSLFFNRIYYFTLWDNLRAEADNIITLKEKLQACKQSQGIKVSK